MGINQVFLPAWGPVSTCKRRCLVIRGVGLYPERYHMTWEEGLGKDLGSEDSEECVDLGSRL